MTVQTSDATQPVLAEGEHVEASLPGQLGRFSVLSELGAGGMGRVFRAYDPHLQREVALKTVRTDARDPRATQRLIMEARVMA